MTTIQNACAMPVPSACAMPVPTARRVHTGATDALPMAATQYGIRGLFEDASRFNAHAAAAAGNLASSRTRLAELSTAAAKWPAAMAKAGQALTEDMGEEIDRLEALVAGAGPQVKARVAALANTVRSAAAGGPLPTITSLVAQVQAVTDAIAADGKALHAGADVSLARLSSTMSGHLIRNGEALGKAAAATGTAVAEAAVQGVTAAGHEVGVVNQVAATVLNGITNSVIGGVGGALVGTVGVGLGLAGVAVAPCALVGLLVALFWAPSWFAPPKP